MYKSFVTRLSSYPGALSFAGDCDARGPERDTGRMRQTSHAKLFVAFSLRVAVSVGATFVASKNARVRTSVVDVLLMQGPV